MRKNLLLLFFAVFLYPCMQYAQNQIKYEFDYDDAGNRIRRTVIEMRSVKAANPQEIIVPGVYHDDMKDFEIKICPNPTKENLKMGIHSVQNIESSLLELTTLDGKQILTQSGLKQEISLNISNRFSGICLMQIQINGKASRWKIVKQ